MFSGQRKKLEEMKAEFEPLTKLMKEACEGLRVLGVLWSCRVGGCRALSEGFVFQVLGGLSFAIWVQEFKGVQGSSRFREVWKVW